MSNLSRRRLRRAWRAPGIVAGGPAIDPTLTFHQDFTQASLAAAAIIGPTLSFTRATAARYFDSNGVMQTAASGAARVGAHVYEGGMWVPKGILIEEQRTNLLLHSADWANAAYTPTNITAVKDATGLDGNANSASTLTAGANNGTILQAITLASAARTSSVYVKRKTGTGTVEFTDDGGSNWIDITSSLSSSLWFRASNTRTQANPSIGFRLGTSGDEIEVDGGQCEAGAFPTSYIPTTTASVTRNADILSTTDLSWFNDEAGTFVVSFYVPIINHTGYLFEIGTGSSTQKIANYVDLTSVSRWNSRYDKTTTQFAFGAIVDFEAVDSKLATAFDSNRGQTSFNGGIETEDTSVSVPTGSFTALHIGERVGVQSWINGYITDLKYYNVAHDDSTLQSETA